MVSPFEEHCQRCNECITVCEESILVQGDGGFPEIDFRRGGCSFCGACSQACRYGAINDAGQPAWSLIATIGKQCLENQGITCRACGDSCYERAIRFIPRIGGGAELRFDDERCSGCGSCLKVCPVQAITISPSESKEPLSAGPAKQARQPQESL